MLAFVVARVTSALVTLLGVSVVIFLAIRLVPGDFVEILVPRGTPEFRAQVAQRLGLDQPLAVQYAKWMSGLLQGDFGLSLATRQPIAGELALRLPITAELAFAAALLALTAGVAIGIPGGLFAGRPVVTTISRLMSAVFMAVPDFVLASVVLFTATRYGIGGRVGGWVSFSQDPAAHLRDVALPALALSFFGIGMFSATTRYAIGSVLTQNHVMAARLRGLQPGQIFRRHVLRNASIPVLTMLSIYLGYLLGGAVLVENIFSIPGFGRYMLQAILTRDYSVVQSGVMLIASVFILLNMLTDVTYAWLDPRLRETGG